MDDTRIYGKEIDITEEEVKTFYNERAKMAKAGNGKAAVLLGRQDPESLLEREQYDRKYILPMLDVGPETRVLDLGCGVGRWAELLMPHCAYYCGVDISDEMIQIAEQTCGKVGGHFHLCCMSVLGAVKQKAAFWGGRFNMVIASGVFMYLNDSALKEAVQNLPNLLQENCILYFSDPLGLNERLTLKQHPSDDLHTAYSAIYRTEAEYLELYAPLLELGFSIVKNEYRPLFGENYPDTRRHHFILQR